MKTASFLLSLTILLSCERAGAELNLVQQALQNSYAAEKKRDYAEALKHVGFALKQEPRNYFCKVREGWLNYAAGSYDQSLSAYQEAAVFAPRAVEAELGAVKAAAALGNWGLTEKLARSVLQTDGANYTALANLAYSYFMQKDYTQAATTYEKVLVLYPSDLDMKSGLAWSLFYQGKKSDAKTLFLEIVGVNPDHRLANQGLGLTIR